jgi:Fe2+ or Zn2+ uptake regulation protein
MRTGAKLGQAVAYGMVDVHGLAESRLRADAQRYTRNRRTLVDALDQAHGPLSLPQLLQRHRQLAQSSAYRNLAILEAAGVVHRIVTSDGFARFELAQELTEHHHHHRVCSVCGLVEDFTLPAALEETLEKSLRRVGTKAAFRVTSHQLDLIGVCANCE